MTAHTKPFEAISKLHHAIETAEGNKWLANRAPNGRLHAFDRLDQERPRAIALRAQLPPLATVRKVASWLQAQVTTQVDGQTMKLLVAPMLDNFNRKQSDSAPVQFD